MPKPRHPRRSAYHGPPKTLPNRIPEPLWSLLKRWVERGVTPETLTEEQRQVARWALALSDPEALSGPRYEPGPRHG